MLWLPKGSIVSAFAGKFGYIGASISNFSNQGKKLIILKHKMKYEILYYFLKRTAE